MCVSPRNASYNPDGSLNFKKNHNNKELVPFQLPCGKCIECLLERSREWSIRCTHEAAIHSDNSFITLTYSPENLPPNGKLNYFDFQLFMKRLRKYFSSSEIGFFMCGEYGEQTYRPHYHACLFGVDFSDKKLLRTNNNGDKIYVSDILNNIWGLGITEIGTVTQQSAAYVARYVLKKQTPDHPQGFQKMSRKYSIGKRWIEKNYADVFIHAAGSIILSDGSKSKVPRYYEKWLLKNKPDLWLNYITNIKPENTLRLQDKAQKEHKIFIEERDKRGTRAYSYKSPLQRKRDILKHKAKKLIRSFL